MSDLNLSFKIEGEQQLARRLNNLGNKVKNFKPEFRKTGDFLKGFFGGEVFTSEGAVLGERWKGGPNYNRLQRSGRMRRSFKAKSNKLSVMIWNAADYFKYHQSKQPRRKLPRRIMMKLTNQLKNKIVQIIHAGVYKRVKTSK